MNRPPRAPAECADARAEIIAGFDDWPRFRIALLGPKADMQMLTNHMHCITVAPLWWVPEDMTDLIDAAATTVPLDTMLTPEMLPERAGIAFYERPIWRNLTTIGDRVGDGLADDEQMSLPPGYDVLSAEVVGSNRGWFFLATVWYLVDVVGGGQAVCFAKLACASRDHQFRWFVVGDSSWMVGEEIGAPMIEPPELTAEREAQGATAAGRHESHVQDRRLAAALWLLSTQDRLADRTDEPLPRPAARRAWRAKQPVTPVRVLRLRSGKPKSGDGTQTVEWTKRWIVKAYWRKNQPWGPGRKLRRPVYIKAHIKGPPDKPLDTRETVWVLNP